LKEVLSGFDAEGIARSLAALSLPGKNGGASGASPLPPFRSRQIFNWIWRGAASFSDMTDLPADLREGLAEEFSLYGTAVEERLDAADGASKLRIRLEDRLAVEAVLLTDGAGRKTACISTQAGCPIGCAFCKTGSLGFARNLRSYEISEQFLHLSRCAGGVPIANIVVMGMGEPLLNLEETRKALELIIAAKDFSPRRITLSTSGIPAGIRELADKGPPVELAFSLTTADEDLRRRLMPGTANIPLEEVKAALAYYQQKSGRRVTLECVLLGGLTAGAEQAEKTAAFARGLYAAVNVIPWNPVEGLLFEGLAEPAEAEISGYCRVLENAGLTVTRRYRKGGEIAGACGQLGVTNCRADGS
jgi:23S rRNA (adenine2503-C2)-methyltransferase